MEGEGKVLQIDNLMGLLGIRRIELFSKDVVKVNEVKEKKLQ